MALPRTPFLNMQVVMGHLGSIVPLKYVKAVTKDLKTSIMDALAAAPPSCGPAQPFFQLTCVAAIKMTS